MGRKTTITAVDMYCGSGGTTTGLIEAAKKLDQKVDLTAINHWDIAIQTHSKNYPFARHYCKGIDNLNPRQLFPSGRLDILVASPECTHHSRARGGVPCSEQSRSSAWSIVRWAEALYIEKILIENVPEFTSWGPLGANGKPMKSLKGQTFNAFVIALQSLGYKCEWRIINTADYGDPTCRYRFFMICVRGNKSFAWPDYTHSEEGGENLFGKTKKWVPARDIIDWSLKGESIFDRKKPLVKRSLERITHGLKTFGGQNAEPFLVMLYGASKSRSINKPVPTITAKGQHIALCEPFLYPIDHGSASPTARSINKPMPTIITQQNYALVEPFLIKYYGSGNGVQSTKKPLSTITTKDRFGLVETRGQKGKLDILYRLLQPHELAAAQSFPSNYYFHGNKGEKVKQIGNAVPVKTASVLCEQLLQ